MLYLAIEKTITIKQCQESINPLVKLGLFDKDIDARWTQKNGDDYC